MQSNIFCFLFAIGLFVVSSGEINASRLELPCMDTCVTTPLLERQRRSSVPLNRQRAATSPRDWGKEKISQHYFNVADKSEMTKLIEGKELNRFSIGERLGSGADAVVHIGLDNFSHETVALKCNKDKGDEEQNIIAKSKLAREFNFIRRFKSRYIIDALQYKRHSADLDCLVLEYAPTSLQNLVDERATQRKRIPVEDALRVFLHVARGLMLLHKSSVVHLDIKPQNIVVFSDATKIIDFGEAIDTRVDLPDGELRVQKGTIEFLSPEMRALPQEFDRVRTPVTGLKASDLPKSDIWALGASMCYVLTGAVQAADSAESCISYLKKVRIMDINIHNLVANMMNRDVDARYDASLAEAGLEAVLQKIPKDWLRRPKVPAPSVRAPTVPAPSVRAPTVPAPNQ